MKSIRVENYNPEWKNEFEKAKFFYDKLLKDIEIDIVHVGSTSIVGLWAKPILDIDIIVRNCQQLNFVISQLKLVGYTHIGNLGIDGREAFKYSDTNPNILWMKHNLYLCMEGSDSLNNHLLLKRHLQNNRDAVITYSKLKRELAKQYPYDIDSYIDGKTALITSFLKVEGMDTKTLKEIEFVNKKSV